MSDATAEATAAGSGPPGIRATWEQTLSGLVVPVRIYLQYLLKFVLYITGWALCCWFNQRTDAQSPWYFQPEAFQKFVLFSVLFEGLGFGCSSGPLSGTGRFWFTPYRYFLTPGTIKCPFIEGLPIFGSRRRSWFDVALYVVNIALLVRALVAPQVLATAHLLPILITSSMIGLTDRAQFLCMRPEQYLYMVVCFMFADDWISGARWVQFAIWMGAGISKLNHIFPYVTLSLAATHPLLARAPWAKRVLMRSPTDMRPSVACKRITYVATAIEISFPILLLLSDGGPGTTLGLAVMTLFHLNIMTSMPPAVPIEWNIFVLFSMWFLFGHHAAAPLAISSPLLLGFLLVTLVALPLIGNLWPGRTSFLIAMRYYAGNWAYSSWLFRGEEVYAKFGQIQVAIRPFKLGITPTLQMPRLALDQNGRTLHLLARGLLLLWPRATGGPEHLSQYIAVSGDWIARRLVGWAFGDGHLHDERLLRAVQERCQFQPGELIHIFVESQPLQRQAVEYRITDAATGLVERGEIPMSSLMSLQPRSIGEALTVPEAELRPVWRGQA
jgi:hypothetical protein